MATRLYPTTNAAPISPSFDSGWEVTSGVVQSAATTVAANYSSDNTNFPNSSGSGVANDDVLHAQLVYGPIAAQTITGTFKGQILCREANASADARAQIIVKVVSPAGTSRGTLIGMDTGALSSEFTVDTAIRTNRKFPRGGAQAVTSTSAQAGDYIVISYGHRNHGTNTGAVAARGASTATVTTDLPEDETTTVANDNGIYRDWFEFSQTISPLTSVSAGAATGTGTASNAKTTIKPNAGAASGTGTAYDAQVSLLAPPRSITINSTDFTNSIRLDTFAFVECANRGEVGVGGIDVDDATNALSIPAMKYGQFDEPVAGLSNKRVWSGFTHVRQTERGPNRVAGQRNWSVELVDLNTLADDFILTASDSADRSIETDYQRVAWLLTSVFGTSGSVSSGVVPNSNTVSMEARDYRGMKPRDVLAECSEAANKLWFIYDYGAGRKLYYDLATGTSLSSSAKISDVAADVDSSTVWAATAATVTKNPDRIYSGIHFTYNEGTVSVTNATTKTTFRERWASVLDTSITDSATATAKANAFLTSSANEISEISDVTITVPAANVNDIRAGHRVQIKLTRHDISSYTYFRVTKRAVTPAGSGTYSDVLYNVTLSLASDVLPSANGSRGRDDVPQNLSNATDDGASVIVDRNGITVTNGAFTLTDLTGQTVMTASGFDGSWADFIRLGLYNARFQNGNQGGIAIGRTSDLPYWTTYQTAGSPTFTGLGGGGVKVQFSALNDDGGLRSDAVPVTPGAAIEAGHCFLANVAAGRIETDAGVKFYQADGSPSATPVGTTFSVFVAGSVTTLRWALSTLVVPSDAVLARFEVEAREEVSHSSSNSYSIYGARLGDMPVSIPQGYLFGRDTRAAVTPSGTSDDYNPGAIDNTSLIIATPSAAWTLRGLVAPVQDWRMCYLLNGSTSNAITIKHDNTNSTAAYRFYTPSGTDYTVKTGAGCMLVYNTNLSRWQILTGNS